MKKTLLFLVFSLNLYAQAPPLDNTFNASETGVYQQHIGRNGAVLPSGKILTSFTEGNGTSSNVILLNADGSLDNTFNSNATYIASSEIRIFPKSDGKFITFTGSYDSYDPMLFKSFNADGTLDATFTQPVLGGPTAGMSINVNKVIYQEDGKIIIVGRFNTVNNAPYRNIVRLNNNGSIDTSFSVGNGFSDTVESIAIQSDGKYVVAGRFNSYNGTAKGKIARLNTNGTIDGTFHVNTTFDSIGQQVNGFSDIIYDVKIQTDGKILAIGSVFRSNLSIVSQEITRLNSNGTRDTSFSYNYSTYDFEKATIASDGKILVSTNSTVKRFNTNGSADNTFTYSNTTSFLPWQPNGEMYFQGTKMIIIGDYLSASGVTRHGIHRVNSNGTIDLTFNPHSGPNVFDIVANPMQTTYFDLKAKVLLDQKILLTGSFTTYNDIPCRNICRVTANGDFDPSFQLDPSVKIYTSQNDKNKIVLQQFDGKILLSLNDAFDPLTYVNNVKKDIIRLNSNGSLDNTFNFNYSGCRLNDIKLMSDGKMLAVGSSNIFKNASDKYKIIRFNLDGTIDTGFTSMLMDQEPNSIDLQADNKILVTFTESNSSLPYKPVIRLNADGTQDMSFNINANGGKRTSYVKSLSSGKMLITYKTSIYNNTNYTGRLNADGTVDTSFNIHTNTYDYDQPALKLLENDNIILYARDSSPTANSRSLLVLSPDGVLLNSFAQNIANDFDVQDCSNIILYGSYNKIDNTNKNNIARYGSPINGLTQSPSGEIYQSFSPGQTLSNLTVIGTNILWYDVPAPCALNNNTTNRNTESLLPSSTALVSGTTYYASQTINGIESNYRLPVTVYQTLGMNDNTIADLKLYPNPIQNNLTVENSANIDKIEIYNLIGHKIFEKDFNSTKIDIDFSNYSSGIYLVKIHSENKIQTNKMVKK